MEINSYSQLFGYQQSSKYVILFSAEERNVYRFGKSKWGQNFCFYVEKKKKYQNYAKTLVTPCFYGWLLKISLLVM